MNGHSRTRFFDENFGWVVVEGNYFAKGSPIKSFQCNDSIHLISFEDIHGGVTNIKREEILQALNSPSNQDADQKHNREFEESAELSS